ncbi:MAG: long-chain fatty acid--CoA ligase, partial [Gammaproteobacteria bacterium]|nr:long-chain fatty acid--CoA ligase [Gammaproteobacteria bacterium]
MSERLQDMVSAQANKTPDSRAVVFGEDSLTYAQLDIQSNRLGRMLQAEGCQTGDRVALVMPKSIEAIVGMLGVLKAGCIYVPIDLDSPSVRVQRIFSASDPKAVLVAKAGSNLLDDCLSIDSGQRKVISTEPGGISGAHFESNHDFSGLESFESNSLNPDTSNSDIAHLLFTSGST